MRLLIVACGLTTLLVTARAGTTVPLPRTVSPAPADALEGFGATTRGGRGGPEIAVTTLDDAGPGSLRAAVAAAGPRTIVFRVAGLITLASAVTIPEPFVTVDGASAPGEGITVRGYDVIVRTHDVVIRHLRFRPGDIAGTEVDAL